jgi:hypothetical protein
MGLSNRNFVLLMESSFEPLSLEVCLAFDLEVKTKLKFKS